MITPPPSQFAASRPHWQDCPDRPAAAGHGQLDEVDLVCGCVKGQVEEREKEVALEGRGAQKRRSAERQAGWSAGRADQGNRWGVAMLDVPAPARADRHGTLTSSILWVDQPPPARFPADLVAQTWFS